MALKVKYRKNGFATIIPLINGYSILANIDKNKPVDTDGNEAEYSVKLYLNKEGCKSLDFIYDTIYAFPKSDNINLDVATFVINNYNEHELDAAIAEYNVTHGINSSVRKGKSL